MIREGFKIMDFYYLFFIISFYVDFFFFFKEGEIKRGEIAVMSGKKKKSSWPRKGMWYAEPLR